MSPASAAAAPTAIAAACELHTFARRSARERVALTRQQLMAAVVPYLLCSHFIYNNGVGAWLQESHSAQATQHLEVQEVLQNELTNETGVSSRHRNMISRLFLMRNNEKQPHVI